MNKMLADRIEALEIELKKVHQKSVDLHAIKIEDTLDKKKYLELIDENESLCEALSNKISTLRNFYKIPVINTIESYSDEELVDFLKIQEELVTSRLKEVSNELNDIEIENPKKHDLLTAFNSFYGKYYRSNSLSSDVINLFDTIDICLSPENFKHLEGELSEYLSPGFIENLHYFADLNNKITRKMKLMDSQELNYDKALLIKQTYDNNEKEMSKPLLELLNEYSSELFAIRCFLLTKELTRVAEEENLDTSKIAPLNEKDGNNYIDRSGNHTPAYIRENELTNLINKEKIRRTPNKKSLLSEKEELTIQKSGLGELKEEPLIFRNLLLNNFYTSQYTFSSEYKQIDRASQQRKLLDSINKKYNCNFDIENEKDMILLENKLQVIEDCLTDVQKANKASNIKEEITRAISNLEKLVDSPNFMTMIREVDQLKEQKRDLVSKRYLLEESNDELEDEKKNTEDKIILFGKKKIIEKINWSIIRNNDEIANLKKYTASLTANISEHLYSVANAVINVMSVLHRNELGEAALPLSQMKAISAEDDIEQIFKNLLFELEAEVVELKEKIEKNKNNASLKAKEADINIETILKTGSMDSKNIKALLSDLEITIDKDLIDNFDAIKDERIPKEEFNEQVIEKIKDISMSVGRTR